MTVGELKQKLKDKTITDHERVTYIPKLMDILSQLSMSTVIEFQEKWDRRKSYAEFVEAQNNMFLLCLECELYKDLGAHVRKALKLEPITEETLLK